MGRWQTRPRRGRGVAWAAVMAGTVALASAAAATDAVADCMAVVNITSYYTRTVIGVVRTSWLPFQMEPCRSVALVEGPTFAGEAL